MSNIVWAKMSGWVHKLRKTNVSRVQDRKPFSIGVFLQTHLLSSGGLQIRSFVFHTWKWRPCFTMTTYQSSRPLLANSKLALTSCFTKNTINKFKKLNFFPSVYFVFCFLLYRVKDLYLYCLACLTKEKQYLL